MQGKSLFDFPIHLGRDGRAIQQPEFTGMEWYDDYVLRHGDDLDEGRLVSLFRFSEPWTSWEMHPAGDEVVCCLQGHMTLHQELEDGSEQSFDLGPGDYAVNPPGAWHTADAEGPVVALFITVGKDTTHRPRD
ncbi:cupin domain-containing protein [Sphingomonas sp. SE220]|uniref:Cupin domain-containing protein n=2 Tax=Sphingomonas hankyongi TaxID=2908209 RepID=A0ABT0S2F9_9SPHN|nr:cupin domain-containing protein [Sphingomonas hankyongi]MCL6730038.1 cupin domain-containing protein [Sphingomonas hankyongi]